VGLLIFLSTTAKNQFANFSRLMPISSDLLSSPYVLPSISIRSPAPATSVIQASHIMFFDNEDNEEDDIIFARLSKMVDQFIQSPSFSFSLTFKFPSSHQQRSSGLRAIVPSS
jgi:hypothetical protein